MCIKTLIRQLSQVAHAIHADVIFSENCYHYIYASRMKYLFVAHGNALSRKISAGCKKWSLLFFNDGSAFISYGRTLLIQAAILLALAEALRAKLSTSVYFT